jgi:light-regulated signal transduction histidine kinase (bacteriophytochrome)
MRARKDGSTFNVSVTVSAIKDSSGKVVGASKVVRDITTRKKAEETIHRLNAELEQRVAQRTAELEAANKELESFSYSVSHDLRAPLRAVDGFSQAMLEDYGPQLPEEGRRCLQTIREGAQRMGRLIDDLLTLSRLGRLPLSKRAVETGDLVRAVLEDLSPQREGRQIEVSVAELPVCQGDAVLLKQVWINLLSNAFKYTRRREKAVIEVGCKREPTSAEDHGGPEKKTNENVYFVRDNGTGFDMRYAGKLFGVFQRLHREEEYEGTGVGLAIVQRIVHRHGGRVWAEAAEDHGATFFFTLGGGSPP